MVDLRLDYDEGILLQTSCVERCGACEGTMEELYLTNKNIICVYQKRNGLFSSPHTLIDKISLKNIKILNEKVQTAEIESDDYGKCLQILFVDGTREIFAFNDVRNELPKWHNAIKCVVKGEDIADTDDKKDNNKSSSMRKQNIFGASRIKDVVESAKEKFSEVAQSVAEMTTVSNNSFYNMFGGMDEVKEGSTSETIEEHQKYKVNFCSNCGTKLNDNAKFCHNCGFSTVGLGKNDNETEHEEKQKGYQERKYEYAGKVLKCPHCGGPITERTVICPDCGMEITGRFAASSVQAFKEQLMEIESHRKKAFSGMFSGMFSLYSSVDPADKQKLSLIRCFPIPNTIDDILEFVMLAIANIDVSLSEKSWANSSKSLEILAIEMPKVISNAWVSKMQQAYQKAEILFPNDPTFKGIQKLYFDKMKELKIKV